MSDTSDDSAESFARFMSDPVLMDLRVTAIYRREDWKVIHRHADKLASAGTPSK